MGELVGGVEPDPKRMLGAVVHAVDEMRQGRNPIDEGGVVSLFASAEQRETLARVQALMSLLEGHGNAVMNRLGVELVDGQARMARVLQARRNARGATAIMQRLLGLELKMKQYEVGEAFVERGRARSGLSRDRRGLAGPRAPPDAGRALRARWPGSPGSTARTVATR